MKQSRIIVALDYPDKQSANAFIQKVSPELCALKIGNYLFTKYGPDYVCELIQKKFRVFLDLKFHDIPNTVFDACRAVSELNVWMTTIHVAGGVEMMCAAREAIDLFQKDKRPLLMGVTVLTSLDDSNVKWLGIADSLENTVLRFAKDAKACKLDGVICSAREVSFLRKKLSDDFLLITPGIRLENDKTGDQKRVMTPHAAFEAGANYLVMGRSITQAKDPVEILKGMSNKNTVLPKTKINLE